jgi:hypothetical protein
MSQLLDHSPIDPVTSDSKSDDASDVLDTSQMLPKDDTIGPFRPQQGRTSRKKNRLSRPAFVLQSIHNSARHLYSNPKPGKVDLSYGFPRRHTVARRPRYYQRSSPNGSTDTHRTQPVSLYSVLARYLDHHTSPHPANPEFIFTLHERSLLRHNGFNQASVEQWATCLLERKPRAAVALFEPGKELPPSFILFLFLRRQHVSASALGVILRHVERRVQAKPPSWSALKILSVRLLRHARIHWPESIPWIASLFVTQANALFGNDRMSNASPQLLFDVTRFSNVLLFLLSLPASINPVLAALNQEKAQFEVLQFMASRTPTITVTRLGFRSVSRNQLAHPKTTEEREWAELKGPSWPPWKEDRTAMDEDKGYEFGASRASKILHRMYEAGYSGHLWEEMVQVYAGWDTDLSPTIQTRTSLPHVSSHFRHKQYLTSLLWGGRVRTTRTRREAWACFLAYELSGAPASQQVYLAMFEKLYHSTMKRSSRKNLQSSLDEVLTVDDEIKEVENDLLPGDMREILPDPTSPLHYVYLSEPIPTTKDLFHRMCSQGVRPSHRLLAFLLETAPTFETCIDILEAAKEDFHGGVGHLLAGQHDSNSRIDAIPSYFLGAFIRCLCRFGRFARPPNGDSFFAAPEDHAYKLRHDRHYLLHYAYALLSRYMLLYRPAWTAYMDKVVRSNLNSTRLKNEEAMAPGDGIAEFIIVWKLVESMENIDLDIDDKTFQTVCMVTANAAKAANEHTVSTIDAHHIVMTGTPRLRKMFHGLVGAHTMTSSVSPPSNHEELNITPPHIPGPAVLHMYVRTLGMLRDYEGLYSFSTWLTRYHVEVTARSEAQHSGKKLLFRTIVALKAAVTGYTRDANEPQYRASDEIVQLIRDQIESVDDWGGWPAQEYVDLYAKGGLKSDMPEVGGR